ncbi:MAG: hypothetical protein JSW73_04495 [Candidatus Woesearchaeota archaeon]|nr:MAG: hypothetical protein JSW73_04495 [Candidatus Woesearchaeota archaeon]
MEKTSTKLIERAKNWYEIKTGFPFHDITKYIREAGYYTRVHASDTALIGKYSTFRIIGSRDRRGLIYKGYTDEVPPEVLVSIEKMSWIGKTSEVTVVCPPDPNLKDLETIVTDTLRKVLYEQDVKDDKET